MNAMKVYEGGEFGQVRTFKDEGGNVWYCGKDVCDYLEYKNITKAMNDHVNESDRVKHLTDLTKSSEAGKRVAQNMVYVNEAGLYSLVLHSKMPKARAFYEHLTHRVLPQIGRTGMYMTEAAIQEFMKSPDFIIRLATNWKDAEERAQALEAENQRLIEAHAEEVKALAEAFDEEKEGIRTEYAETEQAVLGYVASKGCILVRDMATILWQNGVRVGQDKLFALLVEDGFLVHKYMEDGGEKKHYLPTQKSKNLDLFHVTVRTIDHSTRTTRSYTSKVTAKGQMYLLKYYMKKLGVKVERTEKEEVPAVIRPTEQTLAFV